MRQPNMLSSSGNAQPVCGTEAINSTDANPATVKDSAAPHGSRRTAIAPRMHCFEFRELLQAQRQKWLPQPHATIDAVETRALMAIPECRELEEIDAALARIGNGSYGICSDCGGGIGRDRLKTEPTARRCPPCEARQAQIDPGAGQLPAAWPNLDIAFDRELQ